jgi:hypothetical protein
MKIGTELTTCHAECPRPHYIILLTRQGTRSQSPLEGPPLHSMTIGCLCLHILTTLVSIMFLALAIPTRMSPNRLNHLLLRVHILSTLVSIMFLALAILTKMSPNRSNHLLLRVHIRIMKVLSSFNSPSFTVYLASQPPRVSHLRCTRCRLNSRLAIQVCPKSNQPLCLIFYRA